MAKNAAQSGLKMRIARRHADEYDDLVKQSDEACDCQDCEACLKLGVQVFDWIMDADQSYRRDVYAGTAPYDKETEDSLESLLRRWHQNCQEVLGWAAHHASLGFEVAHLAEFKGRCEEAEAILSSLTGGENGKIMSDALVALRDQALEDHRNDQTAEFV